MHSERQSALLSTYVSKSLLSGLDAKPAAPVSVLNTVDVCSFLEFIVEAGLLISTSSSVYQLMGYRNKFTGSFSGDTVYDMLVDYEANSEFWNIVRQQTNPYVFDAVRARI